MNVICQLSNDVNFMWKADDYGTNMSKQEKIEVLISNIDWRIAFSIWKIGDTRIRTRDLSICSRMLYHCATTPLKLIALLPLVQLPNEIHWKIFAFSVIGNCTAGVVVSCKIPILATRVRFPRSAIKFYLLLKFYSFHVRLKIWA